MQESTKQRIIRVSTQTFNREGFGKVSLQDLARNLEMSRGNLTYHFASKEELLKAIFEQLWAKIQAERLQARSFPSFQNLNREVQLYLKYQREYAFIFTDSNVFAVPEIKNALREITKTSIEDNKAIISFAIQVGNMKPEPFPGIYNQLALTTWMLMFFWLPQQIIRGEKSDEDAEKAIWSTIIPHFTQKGIEAFREFYGEDYLNELGESFDASSGQMIMF